MIEVGSPSRPWLAGQLARGVAGLSALAALLGVLSLSSSLPFLERWYPGKLLKENFHKEPFVPPPGMPVGTECHEVAGWLERSINDVTQSVVAEVPKRPKLSRMPIAAAIRVGIVMTDVTNMSIQELSIGHVEMGACRRPRAIFNFVPRLLPDVVLVSVHDVNITQGLDFNTRSLLGWTKGIRGTAVSRVRGELNLTISYEHVNRTRVTACAGKFDVLSTELVGPGGKEHDMPAVPFPMPIGAILCYGPQALLGPVSGIVDVKLEGEEGTRYEGKTATFDGLVNMLNRKFAKTPLDQFNDKVSDLKLQVAKDQARRAQKWEDIKAHGLFGQRELPAGEVNDALGDASPVAKVAAPSRGTSPDADSAVA